MPNTFSTKDIYTNTGDLTKLKKDLLAIQRTYSKLLETVKKDSTVMEKALKGVTVASGSQRDQIEETAKQAAKLKAQQEKYNEGLNDTAKALADLKVKQLTQNQIMKAEAKLANASEGSYNKLSAQYTLNKLKLNALSKEERSATVAGKKLEKETLAIRNSMKKMQEATGVNTLSVGDYKTQTKLALQETGLFSNQMRILTQLKNIYNIATKKAVVAEAEHATAMTASSGASKGLSGSLRILKLALIATGIGAFVVLLGSLITAFLSTQRGIDAMNSVLRPLKAIFDSLIGVVQDLSFNALDGFKNALSNPIGAIKNLGKSIQTFILDKFAQFGKLGAGFVKIIKGDFKAGFEEMNKAAEDITGITTFRNGIEKVSEVIGKAVEDGKKLDALQKQIEKSEIALIKRGAVLEERFNKEKEIAANTALSDKERLNALRSASSAQNELLALQEKDIDLRIEKLKLQQSLNDTSREDLKELAELEAERTRFSATAAKKRTSIVSQESAIVKKDIAGQAKARSEARKAEQREAEKAADQERKRKEKAIQEEAKFAADKKAAEEGLSDFLFAENAKNAKTLLDQQEVQLQTLEGIYQKRLEQLQKFGIASTELDKFVANERLRIINERIEAESIAETAALQTKYDNELAAFDLVQELKKSEFDLTKASSAEKTAFTLEAEKARYLKILELDKASGEKLSIVQLNIIENQIKAIDQKLTESSGKTDIYSLFGFKPDDATRQAVSDSTKFAIEQVTQFADKKVELSNRNVETAKTEVDQLSQALDRELEAERNGQSNRAESARQELEEAKERQREAIREQRKAQRQQQAIETIQQAVSLTTASAKLWGQLGLGAIPAIAIMWGSFIGAKSRANSLAKEQFGEGTLEFFNYSGTHKSGNDIDLGTSRDGKRRRTVERNESMMILPAKATNKYKTILPDIYKSLKAGNFYERFQTVISSSTETPDFNVTTSTTDMTDTNDELKTIRRQGETKTFHDAKGNLVVRRKGHTAIYLK